MYCEELEKYMIECHVDEERNRQRYQRQNKERGE